MTGHMATGGELHWSRGRCNNVSQTRTMTASVSCTCRDSTMSVGWTTGGGPEQHVVLLGCEVSLCVALEASDSPNQETKGRRWSHSYRACPSPQSRSLVRDRPTRWPQKQTRIKQELSCLTPQSGMMSRSQCVQKCKTPLTWNKQVKRNLPSKCNRDGSLQTSSRKYNLNYCPPVVYLPLPLQFQSILASLVSYEVTMTLDSWNLINSSLISSDKGQHHVLWGCHDLDFWPNLIS